MSLEAMIWALNAPIDRAGEKLLLIALANYANEQGESYPSQPSIAVMTSQGERTVRRLLKSLQDAGWIKTVPRGAPGRYKSDLHLLNLNRTDTPGQNGHPAKMATWPKWPKHPAKMAANPSKESLKEKKHACAREGEAVVAVNPADAGATSLSEDDHKAIRDSVQAWAKEHRPDLPFDDTFDDWRDHLIVNGIEFDSQEQAKAMARGWFRRASNGMRLRSRAGANPVKKPTSPQLTFAECATEKDRVIWSTAANIFSENVGHDVWKRWLSEVPILSIIGAEASLNIDPTGFRAEYIRNHLAHTLESALSDAAQRPIKIKFTMI